MIHFGSKCVSLPARHQSAWEKLIVGECDAFHMKNVVVFPVRTSKSAKINETPEEPQVFM